MLWLLHHIRTVAANAKFLCQFPGTGADKIYQKLKQFIQNVSIPKAKVPGIFRLKLLEISENHQIRTYSGFSGTSGDKKKIEYIRSRIGKKKFVIFGLRNRLDTFRYIFSSFYITLRKLQVPVIWVDSLTSSNRLISSGDIVLAFSTAQDTLEIKDDVWYCLYNFDSKATKSRNIVHLEEYTDEANSQDNENWNDTTLFNPVKRTLFLSWGTNLLPWEFLPPTFAILKTG